MKFEFVEFYPFPKMDRWKTVGTLHIYAIDCEMDIRGILVQLHSKRVFFNFPHFNAIDENGKYVRYPFIRFTNDQTHNELMNFLMNEIKPIILERLNIKEVVQKTEDGK